MSFLGGPIPGLRGAQFVLQEGPQMPESTHPRSEWVHREQWGQLVQPPPPNLDAVGAPPPSNFALSMSFIFIFVCFCT